MESKPSWQSLVLRVLYMALGGLLMFLLVESRAAIAERNDLIRTSSRALSIVEKTNETATECLSTLANVRRQLYPTMWEANAKTPFQGQCGSGMGGPKSAKAAAFK